MSGAEDQVISVAELDRRLRRAVEEVTGSEWVEGEVSSLKRASSGHLYFTLKDEREDAAIDCVMYRYHAQRVRELVQEGARVQALGRATLWAPRGRLQLTVQRVRPQGRGALLEALEKLKARLQAEGLFDPERRRPLPVAARTIGVVTSAVGAAFRDICSVAFRRGGAHIVLSNALVQGDGAAESIIRALDLLEQHPGLDVLIVGRGGGAGEDLMAFNDERLVRRLSRTRVPVISAVGHETDFTLSDLVADARAATPSQAAELVVPDVRTQLRELRDGVDRLTRALNRGLLERRAEVAARRASLRDPRLAVAECFQRVDELAVRLERCISRGVTRHQARLFRLNRRLADRHPRAVVADARLKLGPASQRLEANVRARLGVLDARLRERAARLDALSPLAVLGRGYAIVSRVDGRAVRAAREVRVGDSIGVRLSDGALDATVVAVYEAGEIRFRGVSE